MLLWLIPRGCRCVRCQGLTIRGHFKYWTSQIVKKCPIIYFIPLKEPSMRGGGDLCFQKATKGVLERSSPCRQNYRCYVPVAGKGPLKMDLVCFKGKQYLVAQGKKRKGCREEHWPGFDVMLSAFSFKLKNQIPSDWEANVYPWLKTETNKRNPILRCKCQM